jgi:hypothetical protein
VTVEEEDDEEDEADKTPPAPKPERKVPLKGGAGRQRSAGVLNSCDGLPGDIFTGMAVVTDDSVL